jgi:hypothetical protein
MSGRTTRADLLMLQQVASEHITWRSDIAGRTSYRLWSDETTYTIVTPRCRRLADRGLLAHPMASGYTHIGRGPVELTASGRDLLDRSKLEPLP